MEGISEVLSLLMKFHTFSFDFSFTGACVPVAAGAVGCPATFLLRSSSAWASTPVVCACPAMVTGNSRLGHDLVDRCGCAVVAGKGESRVDVVRNSSLGATNCGAEALPAMQCPERREEEWY